MSNSKIQHVPRVPESISFPTEEEKILHFWKEINAFETCLKQSKGKPRYTFYDGPPFATGLPHYGHILQSTIKDIVTRYAHQQGFHVERRFGWDCHGLPIEFEIDKLLNIKSFDDVISLGIRKYNAECRKIVSNYTNEWQTIIARIGRWIDFENDYKTLYPWYMESIWWVFKQLYLKGLVYQGNKVMPYSTACNTPLSNFESGQNYKDVIDPVITVSLPIINDKESAALLIWTTTPWTLPSNLAVCVNPTLIYVRLKHLPSGNTYVLMEKRIEMIFSIGQYKILSRFSGEKLRGLHYEPPFSYFKDVQGAFQVLTDDYVLADSGTGIVHQAPYFGEDDYRVCLEAGVITKNQIPICPVDANGKFIDPITDLKGLYVKDADKLIIALLKRNNKLVHQTQCDMATIPQTIDCELTEDLVHTCLPGELITVAGIVKVHDPDDNCGKNKQHSIFNIYLEVVSVSNSKNQSNGVEKITFNTEDYYNIKQIHADKNLFRYLVHSLCPNIYGHEIVKAGLLLALFKGTEPSKSRAESHVLLMGDPGLGKSQMLRACANVSPRGVYVCGNTSTSSGLTVTMTRESGGEYTLEAGALILADQGCCCIDEFDKMPTQHASLLEAMEQQSISLAKAGMVCSIPTKPSILVAANPVGGHYNKSKTISENLRISSPMLSRFDLIFILTDTSNKDLDRHLSRHVLAVHSRVGSQLDNTYSEFNDFSLEDADENSLRERLRLDGKQFNPLSHNLFRKYIAYAQKYVKPQLSEGAKDIVKEFYLHLRKNFRTGDHTPVTTRQLHSLVRLTQARAKCELREEATERDALDVVEIMKHSINDIFENETGKLDATRSQSGTGVSKKNKVSKLLRILQRKSEVDSKSIFTIKEIKDAASDIGITTDFNNVFESLNIQGFVLNKGQGRYQLNSAYL